MAGRHGLLCVAFKKGWKEWNEKHYAGLLDIGDRGSRDTDE